MIEVLSIDYDSRLHATCLTGRLTVENYLHLVSGAEANLEIQRGVIGGTKAYATLRADIRRGCLLPPIVLAAKNVVTTQALSVQITHGERIEDSPENRDALKAALDAITSDNVYIIDGLQRTNAILRTLEEVAEKQEERAYILGLKLRLELWIDIPFGALAYRMLVLNAGQKPMSIRHQIEILSMKLQEELRSIHGIDVFTSIESRRRVRGGQFQLAKLAQSFQAWLQGQPNLDVRNAVMEQMLADSAIETLGYSIEAEQNDSDGFRQLIEWVVAIDLLLPETYLEFFGSETVLLGVCAAMGAAERNPELRARAWSCLNQLRTKYEEDNTVDHLQIGEFNSLRKGIDTAKVNVGQATREIVFGAFQELFYSNGLKPLDECWRFAASRV